MRRRAIALALLCFCTLILPAVILPVATADEIKGGQSISVQAEQVRFEKLHPERAKFGDLFWRGGISIQSNDRRFGGFSGLVISEDGKKIVAISDKGWWLTAKLDHKNGEPQRHKGCPASASCDKKGQTLLQEVQTRR